MGDSQHFHAIFRVFHCCLVEAWNAPVSLENKRPNDFRALCLSTSCQHLFKNGLKLNYAKHGIA
mgnify:CR=1 FL=1